MKFVLITGAGATGKMTVGQALAARTELRLFHNHMTIEPVIEIMGRYDGKTTRELRDVIFRNFAASDNYGMIFTYIWAFDVKADWDYIAHVKSIFEPYDTTFYCVELIADQGVRLERNQTANRLQNKASKRDRGASEASLLHLDSTYRLESNAGETPFENYLRLDNTFLPPDEAAQRIKETFGL